MGRAAKVRTPGRLDYPITLDRLRWTSAPPPARASPSTDLQDPQPSFAGDVDAISARRDRALGPFFPTGQGREIEEADVALEVEQVGRAISRDDDPGLASQSARSEAFARRELDRIDAPAARGSETRHRRPAIRSREQDQVAPARRARRRTPAPRPRKSTGAPGRAPFRPRRADRARTPRVQVR